MLLDFFPSEHSSYNDAGDNLAKQYYQIEFQSENKIEVNLILANQGSIKQCLKMSWSSHIYTMKPYQNVKKYQVAFLKAWEKTT